jgi:D-alanyl-lipoteichoic acid acyltransferase DltB (MBOAT superfamily)
VAELVILISFKYVGPQIWPNLLLPLGISYYTFQAIAYTVDVRRGTIQPCPRFVDFALFKSFFPIIFGGPIERAGNLLRQIGDPRKITRLHLEEGIALLAWGLFKKVVVADGLAPAVNELFARSGQESGLEVWIAAYGFALQLYADFSGYTDMARGTARLLGFELSLNFNLPFLARNPADFWRRWHISLSSWFADYVFEPFFFRTKSVDLALFMTFFLVGIWHGARSNFIVLGLFHGIVLTAYARLRNWVSTPPPVLGVLLTLQYICLGMLFLRAESISHIAALLRALFSGPYTLTEPAANASITLISLAAPLAIYELIQARTRNPLFVLQFSTRAKFAASLACLWMALFAWLFFKDSIRPNQGFIYFQF